MQLDGCACEGGDLNRQHRMSADVFNGRDSVVRMGVRPMEKLRGRANFSHMKPKKTSRSISAATTTPEPTRDQIEVLAHAIWVDCGCPEGRAMDHWLEAERQLRGVIEPLTDSDRLDPDTAPAARIDRELDRVVGAPAQRSPTSL